MIIGSHSILYSTDPEADRAFFRDTLGMKHVDVGHGWLIFALPPSEVAVHPAEASGKHELYLICDDVEATRTDMIAKGFPCSEISDQGWGRLMDLTLPGGGKLGIYEARHALAHDS